MFGFVVKAVLVVCGVFGGMFAMVWFAGHHPKTTLVFAIGVTLAIFACAMFAILFPKED